MKGPGSGVVRSPRSPSTSSTQTIRMMTRAAATSGVANSGPRNPARTLKTICADKVSAGGRCNTLRCTSGTRM